MKNLRKIKSPAALATFGAFFVPEPLGACVVFAAAVWWYQHDLDDPPEYQPREDPDEGEPGLEYAEELQAIRGDLLAEEMRGEVKRLSDGELWDERLRARFMMETPKRSRTRMGRSPRRMPLSLTPPASCATPAVSTTRSGRTTPLGITCAMPLRPCLKARTRQWL